MPKSTALDIVNAEANLDSVGKFIFTNEGFVNIGNKNKYVVGCAAQATPEDKVYGYGFGNAAARGDAAYKMRMLLSSRKPKLAAQDYAAKKEELAEKLKCTIDKIFKPIVPVVAVQEADPNSQYCFCKKNRTGGMIACEAPNCAIEWYHIRCVNLKEVPEGDWICPICEQQ